jgi:methyl-accepting chemotaxis protein
MVKTGTVDGQGLLYLAAGIAAVIVLILGQQLYRIIDDAPGVSAASKSVVFFTLLFFLLLILILLLLFLYTNRRLQRTEQQNAAMLRARSEALAQDIIAVSQVLALARDGDLTVQVPDRESEVGLLALALNGMISDYGRIVGGIIRTSHAVQEGAALIDEGARAIVESATNQSASVTQVAANVKALATSAADVQHSTEIAITLAANARQAVTSGQESVGRIADAVDAIKEAAVGTTREFKRLQEDSIRLIALVASVKSNAENLDMQAANAVLEARHMGTESGSAFAINIGRLARQAQDTLADAEGAVRSVLASIDEVNRRIEQIAEQVRRGVEEVRAVRTTFEQITWTNSSLVQFIDNVADAAGTQAQSAQQASQAIGELTQVFQHFTDLLVASGDEIAHMRLIVGGLRESVAGLKVMENAVASMQLTSGSAA